VAFLIVIPIITLRLDPRARRVLGRLALAALACAALVGASAACGSDAAADARPQVVVTTPVLGSLVRDLVGDSARVTVVMPNGADPHGFQPSARDVEALTTADLVVENGLGLEEGMGDALDQAREDGVPFVTASDHVAVRRASEPEASDEDPGAEDPHIWMDPIAMRRVVLALAPALDDLGLDVDAAAGRLARRLRELDAEVRRALAAVPPGRRRLVTGHESMGYFADRYGFELSGAIVPSLSSQAQASAQALAELRDTVRATGVPTIFTELGTPDDVAEAIAGETGARVVQIATHTLPDDGSYATFMTEAAATVADGLGGGAPAR
jgi:zinc/manganese transport system substrate-binding protein